MYYKKVASNTVFGCGDTDELCSYVPVNNAKKLSSKGLNGEFFYYQDLSIKTYHIVDIRSGLSVANDNTLKSTKQELEKKLYSREFCDRLENASTMQINNRPLYYNIKVLIDEKRYIVITRKIDTAESNIGNL